MIYKDYFAVDSIYTRFYRHTFHPIKLLVPMYKLTFRKKPVDRCIIYKFSDLTKHILNYQIAFFKDLQSKLPTAAETISYLDVDGFTPSTIRCNLNQFTKTGVYKLL